MNLSIKAAELVATNTRLDYESLKSGILEMQEKRGALAGASQPGKSASLFTVEMQERMETARDPRVDPQAGDKIYRVTDTTGLRRTRQVVVRVNNDITYLTQDGKKRTCWITAWTEWGTHSEVEPPGTTAADVERLNQGVERMPRKLFNARQKHKA